MNPNGIPEPEEWRPIVGWEDLYDASNLGRVRRRQGTGGHSTGRCLALTPMESGYLYVTLSGKGSVKKVRVNIIVAKAFIPNPDDLPVVNHKDTVPTNNAATNLEWTTHAGNSRHAVESGCIPVGQDRSHAKLTEADAREVIRLSAEGMSQYAIAKRMKVSRPCIQKVVEGRSWRHIQEVAGA